ncbi:hypothetical protein ACFV7Q_20570 [Streptomyces sp. NPDC059851]|uniref:hypothetical protein n=1 Tax=Streptomyces sp. NPDC059851 TaxID=3346971 RepID=UPI00364A9B34
MSGVRIGVRAEPAAPRSAPGCPTGASSTRCGRADPLAPFAVLVEQGRLGEQ